jgi:hypothetical protein
MALRLDHSFCAPSRIFEQMAENLPDCAVQKLLLISLFLEKV